MPTLPSTHQPHLTTPRGAPRTPRGVVLVLHGGAAENVEPVGDRSGPWARARLLMWHLRPGLHDAGVAVGLLRYRLRGWNHGRERFPSPVPDARWALDQVRERYGALPVALLGHSMGARTAVAVADDPQVAGVVALAPWFPAGEPVGPLAGRALHVAHGRGDRITSYADTEAFVRRAREVADEVELVDMGDAGHYMLRRMASWNRFALDAANAVLGRKMS